MRRMAIYRRNRANLIRRKRKNRPTAKKREQSKATFEDTVNTDFYGQSSESIYHFICEAMNITDPSPDLLTQVATELNCPQIDWDEFVRNTGTNLEQSYFSEHENNESASKGFNGFDSRFTEVADDYLSGALMSGALHAYDRLIRRTQDDALDCQQDQDELFRLMPMKVVGVQGLLAFDLFWDIYTAMGRIPTDFRITYLGIQLAMQTARTLGNGDDQYEDVDVLDGQMLEALACFSGVVPKQLQYWLAEDIEPTFTSVEEEAGIVKAYWTHLKSRKRFWDTADQDARIRSIKRDRDDARRGSKTNLVDSRIGLIL